MRMIWKNFEPDQRLQRVLSGSLGVSPVIAQLLVNRGVRTPEAAQDFLFGKLSSCHDPFLMKDMDKAVNRIRKAVESREKILVYGDYDVDGVTSTALVYDTLRKMGADCETFIPNRLEEGYGLNIRAVALARDKGVKLLITVDCGINSFEEVDAANSRGIDVIVTDHHEVKDGAVPKAFAVVDPHQKDCGYPYKFLAGVGVAYKLSRALLKGRESEADEHLDLVALGTVADVAPLSGENRILARVGLEKLRFTKKPGIRALMDVSRVEPEKMTCRHIGFALGPRINAMGRVGSANIALDLLLCDNLSLAREMANTLDRENRNRQSIEKGILAEALEMVKESLDTEKEKVIVLAKDSWHPGVIGIVASRLTEEYFLPTILIALDGTKGKGSGRSIDGFNLFEAVLRSSEHLEDFGGHEAACGIRIKADKVDDFRKAVNKAAAGSFTAGEEVKPELHIDIDLPFSRIGIKLIEELRLLMPYGPGNSEPIFSTSGIQVKTPPREIGKSGFKFLATCGNMTCEAVTFKKNEVDHPNRGDIIDLAYSPSVNSWEGIDTIQLNIKDLHISSNA
ncbi:MAG: single-stranded-DNA-specific exonuclease RecJ [Candidatus Omnitrophica bacterium]|nr:single-stranded-DNA-specific exonuclease RecJ [Candidatus Omnitrophota bacterium]MDD4013653.1 single-stranded-DNA-specific exonuclease RecJ [Candidatus Omnitrophota bacterium]